MNKGISLFYKYEEKLFNYKWSFPYWTPAQQTIESIMKKKFTFESVISSETKLKWEVGFEEHPVWPNSSVLIYWKSISSSNNIYLDAKITIELLSVNTEMNKKTHAAIDCVDDKKWCICNGGSLGAGIDLTTDSLSSYLNSKGLIVFAITLSVRLPPKQMLPFETSHQISSKLLQNWKKLQNEFTLMDITILTKDSQRIKAHKLVIRAQCPQFVLLHPAEFSKPGSDIVTVNEFSSKTMRILLHYFYSGELLESWYHDDIIVEFCTAVDLYQLKDLLETFDEYLGKGTRSYNFTVAWELLKLSRKMLLLNAEKRLSEMIMRSAKSAQSPDELMSFLSGTYI